MPRTSLKAAQSSTILDLANQIYMEKTFKFEMPNDPVSDGEKPIGQLTKYEIAIGSARMQIAETLDNMVKEKAHLESQENVIQMNLLKGQIEALRSLFWSSIRTRLAAEHSNICLDSIGIREGGKIVILPPEPEDDELGIHIIAPGMVTGSGLGSLGAVLARFGMAHNCADCDKYDECDLPIKTPRH